MASIPIHHVELVGGPWDGQVTRLAIGGVAKAPHELKEGDNILLPSGGARDTSKPLGHTLHSSGLGALTAVYVWDGDRDREQPLFRYVESSSDMENKKW